MEEWCSWIFSSAFKTIIPSRMVTKLLKDILTDCPQTVRLGTHNSPALTLSTGAPQGCMLSFLSLYTHDMCANPQQYNHQISKCHHCILSGWCSINNLSLNTSKLKELIISFRKQKAEPAPLHIRGEWKEWKEWPASNFLPHTSPRTSHGVLIQPF